MEAMRTRASNTKAKKSKGPSLVEYRAIGPERVMRKSQEMHPPTKDAVMPKPRALPGLPALAMG